MLPDYDQTSNTFVVLMILVGMFVAYLVYRLDTERSPFPPGPRKIPLLGNIFSLDLSCPWALFTKWKGDYGLSHLPTRSLRRN